MTTGDFNNLIDYPHVPLMLSSCGPPLELLRQLNVSVSSKSHVGIDKQFHEVCDAYQKGDEKHREYIRATVAHHWSLLHFAHRMAVRLLTTGDSTDLRHGLLALSLEDQRSDPRETVAGVAMLRYAAEETDNDWKSEFHDIRSKSSAAFSALLQDVISGSTKPVCLMEYNLRHIRGVHGDTIEVVIN